MIHSKTIHIIGHDMMLTADEDSLISCRWIPASNAENNENADNAETLTQSLKEITEYIEGKRTGFSVNIKPKGTDFQMKVWSELRRIPYGETITYATLAHRIGRPKAFRAVANACGANPLPIIIPCHRVVASGGNPGGYTGGLDIKQTLLGIEKQNRP